MVAKVSRCHVKTCSFYSNNDCNAPEIEVNFDNMNVKGDKSEETMCKTFKSNGQGR